jgi:hypothetical protein
MRNNPNATRAKELDYVSQNAGRIDVGEGRSLWEWTDDPEFIERPTGTSDEAPAKTNGSKTTPEETNSGGKTTPEKLVTDSKIGPKGDTKAGDIDQVGNQPIEPIPKPPQAVCTTCVKPEPAPVEFGGSEYYQKRYNDFKARHPDKEPPSYYLNYGKKYADRFVNETYDKLSPEGKEWLMRARRNLQEAIEAKRAEDPAAFDQLEQNDAAFKRFAYDTHPKAYVDAGLLKLPASDLVKIGLTPDGGDLFSRDGAKQMWEVAKSAGPSDYWNVTKATAGDAWSGTKSAVGGAWQNLKDWWNK